MRYTLLIISLTWTLHGWGQNGFQRCFRSSFYEADSSQNPADRMLLWEDCVKGKQIPEFSVRTMEGDMLESAKLKGKIIVLNLWFINCLPCIREIPALNKLVEMYNDRKDDVVFLAVTWETREKIREEFLSKYNLDFTIIPEQMELVEQFGKPGFPTTFVFDREGKVKGAWLGGPVDAAAKTEAIKRVKPVLDDLLASE